MIKHIVMWTFKEFAEGKDKKTNIQLTKEKLLSLRQTVDVIKEIEVGINIDTSDSAYDLVLFSVFESLEDLETYQNHPEHVKVGEFVKKVVEMRAMVDYKV